MTGKSVKLAYIANESTRKTTLKNRKKGLLKKVNELSTLCGIDACAIVYSPNDPQPEVWPSPEGFQTALSRFRDMSELEKKKKMENQVSFLRNRVAKEQEQVKKLKNQNRDKEMDQVLFQQLCAADDQVMHQMTLFELNELMWAIDQKMQDIHVKLKKVLENDQSQAQAEAVAAANGASSSGANAQPDYEEQGANMNPESVQVQEWLMELMNNIGGVDQMQRPFGDDTNNPNPFFG